VSRIALWRIAFNQLSGMRFGQVQSRLVENAESTGVDNLFSYPHGMSTPAAQVAIIARQLWQQSRLKPTDIQTAILYDPSASVPAAASSCVDGHRQGRNDHRDSEIADVEPAYRAPSRIEGRHRLRPRSGRPWPRGPPAELTLLAAPACRHPVLRSRTTSGKHTDHTKQGAHQTRDASIYSVL
jgi:hypothetical protein